MDASRFKKNKIYTLPVKEIRAENTRSFYIVEADGEEYAIPLFEFQKDDPTPERLSCLVKDVHDGVPVFTQNFAPIIARFYEEAKVYPFWVRNDFTQIPNGYYEVADWNGLYFRLQFYGNAKLHVRQRIECRVRSLRENKLCLELVNKGDGGRKIPFLRLRDILQAVHVEPGVLVWADRLFRKSKLFKDAREAFLCDNEEWIVIAIKSLAKNMDLWVVAGNKRNSLYLNLFRNVCIYLLEDSDTLTKCTEQERKAYQTMLSDAIEDTYIYEEAVRLIAQNGHVQCIDSLLRKMQKSGYLYHPERKLKMLMCIFNLQPDIMEEKMQVIFDTILTGDNSERGILIDSKTNDSPATLTFAEGCNFQHTGNQAIPVVGLELADSQSPTDAVVNPENAGLEIDESGQVIPVPGEDEDEEEKPVSMDSAIKYLAKRDRLISKLRPVIGDNSKYSSMTIKQVVKYACDKLDLKNSLDALEGYLKAKSQSRVRVSMDSAFNTPSESSVLRQYKKQK